MVESTHIIPRVLCCWCFHDFDLGGMYCRHHLDIIHELNVFCHSRLHRRPGYTYNLRVHCQAWSGYFGFPDTAALIKPTLNLTRMWSLLPILPLSPNYSITPRLPTPPPFQLSWISGDMGSKVSRKKWFLMIYPAETPVWYIILINSAYRVPQLFIIH